MLPESQPRVLSESQRRVLGNLGEPRSLANLTRVLRADPHGPFDERVAFEDSRADIDRELQRVVRDGLVVALGSHSSGKATVRAVQEDVASIDLPKAKAERLVARLDSPRDFRMDTGPLYVLSKSGLEALTA